MPEYFSNNASSTLDGAINSSVTSINVDSGASFPSIGNFRIKIDDEILLVTSIEAGTMAVNRGIEGTTAASHSDGATVTHLLTAGAMQRMVQSPGDAFTFEIPVWGDSSGITQQGSGLKIESNLLTTLNATEPVQVGYGLTTGSNNEVNSSCPSCFISGNSGSAHLPGSHVIASVAPYIADTRGTSQVSTHILTAITTDATEIEMFIDSTSTITGSQRLVIPPDHSWHCDVVVRSHVTYWHYELTVYNTGGLLIATSPVLVASRVNAVGFESFQFSADSATDSLKLLVTGVSGSTTHWMAKVVICQQKLPTLGGGS